MKRDGQADGGHIGRQGDRKAEDRQVKGQANKILACRQTDGQEDI